MPLIKTKFNFEGQSIKQQRALLNCILSRKNYNALSLKNCTIMQASDLERLCDNSPNLRLLRLENCQGPESTPIDAGLKKFIKNDKNLEILILNGSHITKLDFARRWVSDTQQTTTKFSYFPEFKKLRYLSLKNCKKIEKIGFEIPNIKRLDLRGTKNLYEVYLGPIKDPYLSTLLPVAKENVRERGYVKSSTDSMNRFYEDHWFCYNNFQKILYTLNTTHNYDNATALKKQKFSESIPQVKFFKLLNNGNVAKNNEKRFSNVIFQHYTQNRPLVDLYQPSDEGENPLVFVLNNTLISYFEFNHPDTAKNKQTVKELNPAIEWLLMKTLLTVPLQEREPLYQRLNTLGFSNAFLENLKFLIHLNDQKTAIYRSSTQNQYNGEINLVYRSIETSLTILQKLKNHLEDEKLGTFHHIYLRGLGLDSIQLYPWLELIMKYQIPLVRLDISENKIGSALPLSFFENNTRHDISPLLNFIRSCETLRYINVNNNYLTDSNVLLFNRVIQAREKPILFCSIEHNSSVSPLVKAVLQTTLLDKQLDAFLTCDFSDDEKNELSHAIAQQYQRYLTAISYVTDSKKPLLQFWKKFEQKLLDSNAEMDKLWDGVNDLLKRVPDLLHFKDIRGSSVLMRSILRGDMKTVDHLLHMGAKLSDKNDEGQTVWHQLITVPNSQERDRLFKWLWNNSNHSVELLESKDSIQQTPVLYAVRKGDIAAMDYFYKIGADFLAVDQWGRNVWHLACEISDTETQERVFDFLFKRKELHALIKQPCEMPLSQSQSPYDYSQWYQYTSKEVNPHWQEYGHYVKERIPFTYASMSYNIPAINLLWDRFSSEAVDQNHLAEYELGTYFLSTKNDKSYESKGMYWLQRASQHGSTLAKKKIATIKSNYLQKLITRIQTNDESLTCLALNDLQLNDQELTPFFDALLKNEQVEEINLNRNLLTIDTLYKLARILSKNKHIKRISFDDNSTAPLHQTVIENNSEEKSDIQHQSRESTVAYRVWKGIILPLLEFNTTGKITTTDVDLHGCQDEIIRDIFIKNLRHYTNLISLNLSELNEAKLFIPLLKTFLRQAYCSLEVLDLSKDHLTQKDFYKLSDIIQKNRSLKELNLSDNKMNLKFNQLKKQYRIFTRNPHLRSVDVSGNFTEKNTETIFLANACSSSKNAKMSELLRLYNFYRPAHPPSGYNSILMPNHRLKKRGENAWVVAIGCPKNRKSTSCKRSREIQRFGIGDKLTACENRGPTFFMDLYRPGHTYILLEGLKKDGQRFLEMYHVFVPKTSKDNKTVTEKNTFNFNDHLITSMDCDPYVIHANIGEKLQKNVQYEINNNIQYDYSSIPIFSSNDTDSSNTRKVINCSTWCFMHLEDKLGLTINKNRIVKMIPALAAKNTQVENNIRVLS